MNVEYGIDEEPLLRPIVKSAEVSGESDTTLYYFDYQMIGRGEDTYLNNLVSPEKSYYPIWVIPEPVDNRNADIIFAQFIPTGYLPNEHENYPVIRGHPDSSVVMLIPCEVNPDAQDGDQTYVWPRNDETGSDFRVNMFSDSTGLFFIAPELFRGTFIVGEPLLPGKHTIRYEFKYDGGEGFGNGGNGTLFVDGKKVAEGRIDRTMGIRISLDETFDVGADAGEPVSEDYHVPYNFPGTLKRVDVHLGEAALLN